MARKNRDIIASIDVSIDIECHISNNRTLSLDENDIIINNNRRNVISANVSLWSSCSRRWRNRPTLSSNATSSAIDLPCAIGCQGNQTCRHWNQAFDLIDLQANQFGCNGIIGLDWI